MGGLAARRIVPSIPLLAGHVLPRFADGLPIRASLLHLVQHAVFRAGVFPRFGDSAGAIGLGGGAGALAGRGGFGSLDGDRRQLCSLWNYLSCSLSSMVIALCQKRMLGLIKHRYKSTSQE